MSKKSPQLRFEGFTDDWEQRKLNEVSDIYDGTHQTPKYQDDGVMFLSVENIKTLTSNKFISREAFEDEFKIRPQRGDVLMTRIGDIGTANVVETDEDLAYYVSLALFKSEELNPYFLQASIYAPFVQDQIWKRTLHIAFPKKINKNEIGQVPINVPTLAEQTKIGSFFKQLDNTITLHQRKLDLLKEQKKGYLQKMFPKNGAKVPELRFAGFAGDWEERKLIEVADYRNGKAHEKDISEYGDYIVVNSKFVSTNGLVKKYSDEMIAPLSKNEIAFVLSDVPNGRAIARTFLINEDNKYSLNQRIAGITPHADTNSYFLHSLMNRNHYFLRFDDGVSQTNLSKKEVEKWVEFYPSYEEQQKIGAFFKHLDGTIALHQRKLDLLKEQKKGFLQKMFV
ncbi:restriction endonuclease subunit S [Enterococcus faecalis]|uniref:restriction endonuclease subunit S n=1 Tax=Enterococcus faecalis TaxID=1351 RepID=UPI00040BECB4|nr:restriction endonuclease subunit S [Enterococcus faecalis]MCU2201865.1 restriction endonuclease subunit S [Enterococcus faecalis]